jgi:transcriptional regulator with XRE-family HTH domain
MTAGRLRERMTRRGVTVTQLAHEAGEYRPNVAAILNGKQYVSRERLGRIAAALERLEREPARAPIEVRDKDGNTVLRLTL